MRRRLDGRYKARGLIAWLMGCLLALTPTFVSAQSIPQEVAPFYNALFGPKAKGLIDETAALAAERGKTDATLISMSNRLNDLLERLLEHDAGLAARLGKRMRIASSFYLNGPLTDYQFRTILGDGQALLKLGKRSEAIQATLPIFATDLAKLTLDEKLLSRWTSLRAGLLDGEAINSAKFQQRLSEARRAQDEFRKRVAPAFQAYVAQRQILQDVGTNAETQNKVLQIAAETFDAVDPALPFMSDIASIASWAAFYKNDVAQADLWLSKLDKEPALFFAFMPIHPGPVYGAWTSATAEQHTVQKSVSDRVALYTERAYALMRLQYANKGHELANIAIQWASVLRNSKETLAAETMRQHAQKLIRDNEPGSANLLLRLGLETSLVGRLDQAERLFSRALASSEATAANGSPLVENILKAWADVLVQSNRLERAEQFYNRLLKIDGEKAGGPTRASVNYLRLLSVAKGQGGDRAGESETLAQAEALAKKILKADDSIFADLTASRILQQMTGQSAPKSDPSKPSSANTSSSNAQTLVRFAQLQSKLAQQILDKQADEARKTLAELEALSPGVSLFAEAFANFAARISLIEDDFPTALSHFRRASKIALARGTASGATLSETLFASHAWAAIRVASKLPNDEQAPLVDEAFEIVQNTAALSVAKALARAQNRSALSSDGVEGLRKLQDTELALRRERTRLVDGLANDQDVSAIQERVRILELELRELQQTTQQPLASFDRPKPVSMATAIGHLEPDEALIMIATVPSFASNDTNPSLIFTLTRDADGTRTQSYTSAEDRAFLINLATRLRCQAALTDPSCGSVRATTRGVMSLDGDEPKVTKLPKFDFELAYEAYRLLVEPYAKTLKGRDRLIIIPDKTLVSMPFHLMLTEPPDENTTLENAPWLIRSKSITVVPSISSFHAFRQRKRIERDGNNSFLGVGDPLIGRQRNGSLPFECEQLKEPPLLIASNDNEFGKTTRAKAVSAKTLLDLEALPETRCELQAIANSVGQPSKILLHNAATEHAVKQLSVQGHLEKFDIVSFATHGLIAGELGENDAGLVLTPPKIPSDRDNGILTSAEISGLRLNADLVLLSACNTAAPEQSGQEGLSGLASAFFHAGARSLLVSHWPVYSDAATRLTTGLIEQRKLNPKLDKAQAQRLAVLALINDTKATQRERHPAYWAPFMLVGDNR